MESEPPQFTDMKTKQLAELSDQLKRINSRSEIIIDPTIHHTHDQLNDAKKELKLPLENTASISATNTQSQVNKIV